MSIGKNTQQIKEDAIRISTLYDEDLGGWIQKEAEKLKMKPAVYVRMKMAELKARSEA